MSLALVYSRALSGMNAPLVEVEAHLANGLPHFNIVGLPDMEVKESRDRVRAAIIQSGFEFPAKKITVNLAPADLPKESGRFDLPIAIGILAASGQVAPEKLEEYEFAGELALSGLLRPVRGALAMAWQGMQAKRAFVLPEENAGQAAVMRGITVYGARSLGEVAAHLNGIEPLAQTECQVPQMPFEHGGQPDLCDVKGQHTARLALEIAAAGGHSLLMMGPPGTGKSMLSQRLPGILPPLTEDELVEVWALRSLLPNHQQQL
ncbi:TPA: ATP-binding protein, partial [Neisseria meningitidis]